MSKDNETSLSDVLNIPINLNESTPDLSNKNEDELLQVFFDGNEDIKTRITALEVLSKTSIELCYESVNKVTSMFLFSPNHIFRNLIKSIGINTIPLSLTCIRLSF